jgi:hypothetical protein
VSEPEGSDDRHKGKYSDLGRYTHLRRFQSLNIPIRPILRPQLLNVLHTAYRTTLSMVCHSICDSVITQYTGIGGLDLVPVQLYTLYMYMHYSTAVVCSTTYM